ADLSDATAAPDEFVRVILPRQEDAYAASKLAIVPVVRCHTQLQRMPWWAVRVFYAAAAIGEWRFLHTTSSREREARVQSTRSREFLLYLQDNGRVKCVDSSLVSSP